MRGVRARRVRPRADRRLQRELPVQIGGPLSGAQTRRRAVGGGVAREQPLQASADRPGRSDRPERDPGPRGYLRDRQGVHDRRPAQRADRAAREDRARQFGLLRSQELAESAHFDR